MNDFDLGNDESAVEPDLGSDSTAEGFDPMEDFDPCASTEAAVAETTPESANALHPNSKAAKAEFAELTEKLVAAPPVFEYAGATENIEDSAQTFEDLRIAKAADFPELEDGKKITWSVEYGKVTKSVMDAKGTTVAKMKEEIESSKAFTDALKKAKTDKDKNPVCKVKPRVTAQSKGTVTASAYKGTFINEDEAIASGKLITLFPGRCGNVFEQRNTEMGRFTTKAANNDLLRSVNAGFIPALPLIPLRHLQDIIAFFKMMASDGNNEALANIYWDKQDELFITDIPQQSVSMFHVKGEINPAYDNERYIHYLDIHSHNTMKAYFSAIDDADEKATRVYAVVGEVLSYFPQIRTRISNGGKYHEIDPSIVFENFNKTSYRAKLWFDQLQFSIQTFSNVMNEVFNVRERHGDDE